MLVMRRTIMSRFLRGLGWGIAALCILIVALSLPGFAENTAKPSYDCAAASGRVEKLVCADEELALLDQKLAAVFASALKQTKVREQSLLVAQQRGFIKGKNDCWKARDVRDCTAFAYRDRIVELQVRYGLVPARGPFTCICDDQPATRVVATYFETDPPSVRIDPSRPFAVTKQSGDGLIAKLERSASGSRYVGQNFTFWIKGEQAILERYGEPSANCIQKP
jgi:uncharacterized protein